MALLASRINLNELPSFFITLVVVVLAIAGLRKFILSLSERGGYRGQLIMFVAVLLGLLGLLIAMPFEENLRGEVFQLVGWVLSAAVALSSTTFLGNLIAGGMLRTIQNFELGDWVRVDGHFGRVTERGLLHTEIQTEDRDLTTLPNLLMATKPVKVVRSSGTIISAAVGIGYDVPHARVETSLLRAAATIELEDAFVSITELGDFAVTYRVAGKLNQVDRMISRRSKLRRAMLDALHEDEIEIMSPTFINVANRKAAEPVIPGEIGGGREAPKAPEETAFDKADVAKGLEAKRATIVELAEKKAEIEKRLGSLDGQEKAELEKERDRMVLESERLQKELEDDERELKDQPT